MPQLPKVAQLYRRPLAAFYLPRPEAEEPVHDFRRIQGQTVSRSSPTCCSRFDGVANAERSHWIFTSSVRPSQRLSIALSHFETDPEAVAGIVRALLYVQFEEQRSWQEQYEGFDNGEPGSNPRERWRFRRPTERLLKRAASQSLSDRCCRRRQH